MFASVSTYQGPPDQIDDGLRYAQENIVPSLQEVEGFEESISSSTVKAARCLP